jgi:hypothetical protein
MRYRKKWESRHSGLICSRLRLLLSSSFFIFAAFLLATLPTGCGHNLQAELNISHFLNDLTNVSLIAYAPVGTAEMISSYDRTGGNQDWGDYSRLPVVDGKKAIIELDGPGVIHRIWMTGQYPDKWSFYFDGERKARISGIDARSDEGDGVRHAFAKLQNMESGGYSSYVPIPFNKKLKITVPADFTPNRPYYQINYELFPKNVKVESFPSTLSGENILHIDAVRNEWDNLDARLKNEGKECGKSDVVLLHPKGSYQWINQTGGGIIKALRLDIIREGIPSLEQVRILRDLVLKIWWDDSDKPSVNVPVGDFFNNAFHYRRHSSMAIGKVGDSFVCRFPMPFQKAARVELTNEGEFPVKFRVGQKLGQPTEKARRYFHCGWNQTMRYSRPERAPHKVLQTKGRGHLAGLYLNAIGMDPNWFILEGDDIIYRDGESLASFHGTGLEDYFNGAWYYFGLSDLAFAGLLEKASMRTAQYRYHFPDKIDFDKNLNFEFEFGHVLGTSGAANSSRGYMSSTVYWYQEHPVAAYDLPVANQRIVPVDPLKEHTIMAELIELELIGHYDEARDRAEGYAEIYRGKPTGDLMALRLAGYDIHNGDAVSPLSAIDSAIKNCREEQVINIAKAWKSLYEDSTRRFVHVNTSCSFNCYLDGRKIISGNKPRVLHSQLVALPPGEHEFIVEIMHPGPVNHPWLAASIQGAETNLHFTTVWEMNATMSADSISVDQPTDNVKWSQVETLPFHHIRQENWALAPNCFVGMQSQPMLRVDKDALSKSRNRRIYYRKKFAIDEVN